MNKILMRVGKTTIVFSLYTRNIEEPNMNNTNVINVKDLKFTEEYIESNLDLMASFLNVILIKSNITSISIKNNVIAPVVLKLIQKMPNIKHIVLEEDTPINYTISSLLVENNNLESVECYSLPDIMFYRFKNTLLKTRSRLLSTSNFLKENNITTYSDLCNKEKIRINENLMQNDVDDIIYFLKNNKRLRKIELLKYSKNNLDAIIYYLKENKLKHVTIIIHESSDTTNLIFKDYKHFEKINKEKNINIKIKYSKEYKEKNKIKEFNLRMFKNILITLFLVSILAVIVYKVAFKKDVDNIEKTIDEIKEIQEQVSEEESTPVEQPEEQQADPNALPSVYSKNYGNTYNELLKVNKDTVGWLKVNNTKINYPVVQGKDNDYYLTHAFDNSVNLLGWIYVDYRNTLEWMNKNTIIYGHSMAKNGVMFTTLKKVLSSDWNSNKNNQIITFSIKGKTYKWQIFSVYTIADTNDYLYIDFNTDAEFFNFVNKLKNRSIKNFNVNLLPTDNILTLSTCYGSDKNRLVVHAKLIK